MNISELCFTSVLMVEDGMCGTLSCHGCTHHTLSHSHTEKSSCLSNLSQGHEMILCFYVDDYSPTSRWPLNPSPSYHTIWKKGKWTLILVMTVGPAFVICCLLFGTWSVFETCTEFLSEECMPPRRISSDCSSLASPQRRYNVVKTSKHWNTTKSLDTELGHKRSAVTLL